MDVGVNESGHDIRALHVNHDGIGRKVLLLQSSHIEDIPDLTFLIYIKGAILEFCIPGYDSSVGQYSS
jgi:hypothetical protein